MTTPTYASALNGWNGPTPGPAATPADYYAGPAGVAPGGGGFAAAVVFRAASPNTSVGQPSQLWSNQDAVNNRGWLFQLSLGGGPSMAVTASIGDGAAFSSVFAATQEYGGLIALVLAATPTSLALYLNGLPASRSALALPPLPAATAPVVGIQNVGGVYNFPATGIQILGVAYQNAALGVDAASEARAVAAHFEACQRATDMSKLNAGVPGGVDWTNRWTVREGAVQAGNGTTAPTIWLPSAGSANLTRVTDLPASAQLRIETPTNPNWF